MQATGSVAQSSDREYDRFLARVRDRFAQNTRDVPVFTTDASELFGAYLLGFEPQDRQHHTCHACRHFFERFGGLVTIDESGRTHSAMWDPEDAPEFYRRAVEHVLHIVKRSKVTGVFLSGSAIAGTPTSRDPARPARVWHHFHVEPKVHRHPLQSAFQAMAEKREDHHNVSRALAEFSPGALDVALNLLQTDSLYRAEKVLGPVQWLRELHRARAASREKSNVLWRAIATAPAGFCHPRSGMAGSLLEDIAAGMPFEVVSKRFADKMHPLQYQRPQAPPSAGTIAQAEKAIAALDAAGSLARRHATLDDVTEKLWEPRPIETARSRGGVFAHLLPNADAITKHALRAPAVRITWEKFLRTVLPTADSVRYYTANARDHFVSLVTAENPEAPPILQWGNPVSWYVWNGGSPPSQYGLQLGAWVKVAAITYRPQMWGDPEAFSHIGRGVILLLDGAHETRPGGSGMFPEFLRSELHGVRSVIEAYSNRALLPGRESSACGIALVKGQPWDALVRVTSNGIETDYRLDRWD